MEKDGQDQKTLLKGIPIIEKIKTTNGYILLIEKGLETPLSVHHTKSKIYGPSYTGMNPVCWI